MLQSVARRSVEGQGSWMEGTGDHRPQNGPDSLLRKGMYWKHPELSGLGVARKGRLEYGSKNTGMKGTLTSP